MPTSVGRRISGRFDSPASAARARASAVARVNHANGSAPVRKTAFAERNARHTDSPKWADR